MIFKHQARRVVDGRKRQTRRPVKAGDMASHDEKGNIVAVYRNGRLLWKVGKDYAAQPGRGKRAIGRTPPVEAIRQERLWEITMEDAFAEGVHSSEGAWAVDWFSELWDRIYDRKNYRYQGFRWRDNPEVWVLEFEPVEDFDEVIMRETEAAIEGGIIDGDTGLPYAEAS